MTKNTMQQGHTFSSTVMSLYEQELRKENPAIQPDEVDKKLDTNFASWFESHVKEPKSNVHDEMIKDFASGPLRKTRVYSGYYVNGFKFHVARHNSTTSTSNSGVCVKGSINITAELDYYGVTYRNFNYFKI
ncbi:uncharacterized protein [Primulina huaijiensis]|uniref:uncharacterized protein n=1 Tax=Primulina huaijiensis TaxID=1492673 RepID=UPI003CC6E10E